MLIKLGIATRVALLVFGEVQDRLSAVKYTDIDYEVFTDAAAFIVNGQSPYQRSTYRYTPLLALILTPNVLVYKIWGKALFCAADLWAAWLIQQLLTAVGAKTQQIRIGVACWLFNPFTVTISTRGSGEALVAVQILLMLQCLLAGQTKRAATLLGLATHWRVYPIIYSLPIFLWLPSSSQGLYSKRWPSFVCSFATPERLCFAITAAVTFIALGGACYAAYGQQFLQETYLYHSGRKDPRHNFSIYFYNAYLTYQQDDLISWLAPFTQIVSTAAIAIRYAKQLPLCMMLQTMAFVAFNKVCTAQYFVWWFSLLPLVLPQLNTTWREGVTKAFMMWVLAQLHWLAWAYLLEFQGYSIHLEVWLASLLVFMANVHLMTECISCSRTWDFSKAGTTAQS